MACSWAFEDVWALQELAELLLEHLDVPDLRSLRASSKLLKRAVDGWGIERLVIRDDMEGHQDDLTALPERFPVVRRLVLRSISPRTLDALNAFGSLGHLSSVEYDECELDEDDMDIVRVLPSMPVDRLVVQDCVFASQQALDGLCAVHPANAVRIENVRLRLAGQQELMIIGNEEQQFAARFCASRKQCVIPEESTPTALSFTQNIHLSPQRPLWKSPAALATMQTTLERLDLSGNALALENVQLLFYEGQFSRLAKLRLRSCCLTESHMEIISQATSCVSLDHLDLSDNRLGTPIALYYLASSQQLTSQLRFLSLADQEETTDDWLYGLALTTSHWERLETFNASYSAHIGASSMLGICESMPRLRRLLLHDSYVTKDALALFGQSPLFSDVLEEVDFSVGNRHMSEYASRGVEARRVEDCFCVRRATRLKKLKLRASATRQSRKYDRKALKLLKAMHGDHVAYIVRGL